MTGFVDGTELLGGKVLITSANNDHYDHNPQSSRHAG